MSPLGGALCELLHMSFDSVRMCTDTKQRFISERDTNVSILCKKFVKFQEIVLLHNDMWCQYFVIDIAQRIILWTTRCLPDNRHIQLCHSCCTRKHLVEQTECTYPWSNKVGVFIMAHETALLSFGVLFSDKK